MGKKKCFFRRCLNRSPSQSSDPILISVSILDAKEEYVRCMSNKLNDPLTPKTYWSILDLFLKNNNNYNNNKNFMAPFYGCGSTASRLKPLRGGSLVLTTKSSEIPGNHFLDLGRMKS